MKLSRTDVHAPAWVKERDPLWRDNHIEDHNHSWYVTGHEKIVDRYGDPRWVSIWKRVERCDLDVYLAASGRIRTACQIRYVHTGRNIHCGCRMCSGYLTRRQDRRGQRHHAKKMLRSGRWEDGIPPYTGFRW